MNDTLINEETCTGHLAKRITLDRLEERLGVVAKRVIQNCIIIAIKQPHDPNENWTAYPIWGMHKAVDKYIEDSDVKNKPYEVIGYIKNEKYYSYLQQKWI